MSFFIRKNTASKTKRALNTVKKHKSKLKPNNKQNEKVKQQKLLTSDGMDSEDIPSDESSDEVENDYENSIDEETQQEKRLRLTKQYLEEIEKEEKEKSESLALDKDVVAHRLKNDALDQAGKLQKKVADEYAESSSKVLHILKGHQLPITCLTVSSDEKLIFSASKDCSIRKWCLQTGKKLMSVPGGKKGTEDTHKGHTAHILGIALSSDSMYLATGCANKVINIWNPSSLELVHTFKSHREAISGLVFQKGTHQLFSVSHDRSLKVWNLDEMTYVETMFGHQDQITSIDCLRHEVAITSGGRDNTIRIWKISEESQLVFQGNGSSIDCVRLINNELFISGSDDGCLSIWSTQKKKPLFQLPAAHGCSPESGEPYWISAVSTFQNTDLVASGSQDGLVRLWKWEDSSRKLIPVFSLSVLGFVNAIEFTSSGSHLVIGAGQEHRLGRWWRLKNAKNVIYVYELKCNC